jgi:hypothetical protein
MHHGQAEQCRQLKSALESGRDHARRAATIQEEIVSASRDHFFVEMKSR